MCGLPIDPLPPDDSTGDVRLTPESHVGKSQSMEVDKLMVATQSTTTFWPATMLLPEN